MDEAPRWFVLIGAQKAGTTSLFEDLRSLEGIEIPDTKERGWFDSDSILTQRAQRRFYRSYRDKTAVLRGDVSTSYSKRDEYPGVPQRVSTVLGSATKIIYLVRDPLERMISQHHFESGLNLMPTDFSQALASEPSLIRNSEYGFQLSPWLDHFPNGQILIVDFHRYVADRRGVLAEIADFLDYPFAVTATDAMSRRHNPTQGAKSPQGVVATILLSKPYRLAKRFVPRSLRQRTKGLVLSANSTIPAVPSANDRVIIDKRLRADRALLNEMAGAPAIELFEQSGDEC